MESDASRFETAIRTFADAVATGFRSIVVTKPEDVLNDPVRDLLKECAALWEREVESHQQVKAEGIGWPDIGVAVQSLLCGYIELKAPEIGINPTTFAGANREQWNRYKALPNLIYTNGSEWALYRTGKRERRVRIAEDIRDGSGAVDPDRLPELRRLLYEFVNWEPITPKNAKGLAEFLAPLARFLRDEVQDALKHKRPRVQRLADDWRSILFADADDAQFADAFAQTLTYALLLARFEGAVNVRHAFAVDTLQEHDYNLLATALNLLATAREELEVPIELLERAIGVVNAPDLLRDRQRPLLPEVHETPTVDNDPWLYFYEDFLAAYDPKLRKNHGVYFTPLPVVRAQVRFAGELLRDRFVKRDGFADDSVTVLDPACGTGAYPLAVMEDVAASVLKKQGEGLIPTKLRNLATRLHAFEILVGPYAVTHLRMTQRLHAADVTDQKPLVYLADTLESPNVGHSYGSQLVEPLTQEREQARILKQDTEVLVCLGNPPYDREQKGMDEAGGKRKGGWVRYGDGGDEEEAILEDFARPVRDAGDGGQLKNIYNDYVYFWRWALWKVFEPPADQQGRHPPSDGGIVTFITASSYLGGPGFAGMRQKMREVFDDLWIIDLGGDSLGARKTENVFAIKIPVAIAVGVRSRGHADRGTPARVWRTRLKGTAQEKLDALDQTESLSDLAWEKCSSAWDAPFFAEGTGTYFSWPKVTDVFPWQHSGGEIKRTWPIGETEGMLTSRWRALLARSIPERRIAFRETQDRRIDKRYQSLFGGEPEPAIADLKPDAPAPPIRPYAYRSLDRQWVIAATSLADRSRPDLWRAHGDEQVYLTSILTDRLGVGPAALAAASVPDRHHFFGRGGKDVIPLYRDAAATEPNVTDGLLGQLGSEYGSTPPRSELMFAYAYGILSQPAYVERFWDELEQPPPRLPITKDADLFGRVAGLGERLLYLHTYGERFAGADDDGSVPQGEARCTKAVSITEYPEGHRYDADRRTLIVGEGEHAGLFEPVAPEVWDYSVSGMPIVKSWLDRRKREPSGRKSSPLDDIRPERWEFGEELLDLLWVLEHTVALQPEGAALLDEVCNSPLFAADEMPTPRPEERTPPTGAPRAQIDLL